MYSVEFGYNDIVVTVLDETGNVEDAIVTITDGLVVIEQVELLADLEIDNRIVLTYAMLKDLMAAYESPEGFYKVEKNQK